MAATEIEALLKRRLGLDAESIGSSAIARAVQERMEALEMTDTHAYGKRVAACEIELQQLIELVVVPETWFFRDTGAFAMLAQLALREWLPAHPEGVLRLLSLPCSSGEEAYSMAMALLDAGFPAGRFYIDAVDVSTLALARAKNAVYGRNSFRSRDLSFRDRHFKQAKDGYHLAETVRRQVRFQSGNVIDDGLLPGLEIYDAIFCRNLLIYFDRPTQDHVVKVLLRLLKEEGVVFVGPSEAALLANHKFASLKVPLAFAFRKTNALAAEAKKTAALPLPVKPAPDFRPATHSSCRAMPSFRLRPSRSTSTKRCGLPTRGGWLRLKNGARSTCRPTVPRPRPTIFSASSAMQAVNRRRPFSSTGRRSISILIITRRSFTWGFFSTSRATRRLRKCSTTARTGSN